MHKKTVIDFRELGLRQTFTQPIKELKTRDLDQVQDLLAQVEAYQEAGYYVVGYVSYEASPAFEEKLQVHRAPLLSEYLLYFTVHDQVETSPIPLTYEDIDLPDKWQTQTSAQEYEQAIATIHHHIRQGDTYQVNYTIQLDHDLPKDSFAIYNRLVVEQGASYNAYVEHDDMAILSISPELFFKQEGRILTTRPMKGTTSRGFTHQTDLEQASWLAQDPKNRAENMMIVDLLRNDMNRISEIGSEKVIKLCDVEQYSTVWQMTSTIQSQLRPEINLVETFKALFPCGSITGAPKISTMEIIKKVEKAPRGVYCGTVGICLPNGSAIFNVAIRTIQKQGTKAIYGVGGGITWDSTWESEYRETQQKSAVLYRKQPVFDLITTGKISLGKLTFIDQHLERLQISSRYFAYPFDKEKLLSQILEICQNSDPSKDYRLRIAISKDGTCQLDRQELQELPETFCQAKLRLQDADLNSPFRHFKTSCRPHLNIEKQEQIYYNRDGYLLETSIGNIVLKLDGKLYTPPLELGILDGIYRNYLLKNHSATEKSLTLEDLKQAEAVYACNAVRGLYQLNLENL